MQSCDCQSEETISYASGWRALGTASRNGKKLSTRVRVYTIRVNYTGTLCIKVIVFYCNMTTNSSNVFFAKRLWRDSKADYVILANKL